jgi:tetratricopeptide (TPR) repeat protein
VTPARTRVIGVVVTVTGIALAAAALHARDSQRELAPSTERLLYLRSGRTADRIFLTFDALAADIYWMRTIQHYGRDRKRPSGDPAKFELLQPLLDLTTTLDPRFNVAYRFGAIFLSSDPPDGPGAPAQAIALLEKGLAANPRRWQYAHDIGFIHYWHTGDYAEAARWFNRTADMPGAPAWVRPLAATTLARGGDRVGARQLLGELLQSQEPYVRNAATRALAQLQALDGIDQLQALVERFRAGTGHDPAGWADLIRAGLLAAVPTDITGTPFVYDATTHQVSLSPDSELFPLPPMFVRQ